MEFLGVRMAADFKNARMRFCLSCTAGATLLLGLLTAAEDLHAQTQGDVGRVLLAGASSASIERAIEAKLLARGVILVTPDLTQLPNLAGDERQRLRARSLRALKQGRDAYYEAQPRKATQVFETLLRQEAKAMVRLREYRLLRTFYVWLGVARVKQGNEILARRWFTAALDLDRHPLDATRFPPSVLASYSVAARSLRGRKQQRLQLAIEPRDAAARLNARLLSKGDNQVPRGAHWLHVRAVGYEPYIRQITVGDTPLQLAITLKAAGRQRLGQQLSALAQQKQLDLAQPPLAAAMGRFQGVAEALVVREMALPAQQVQISLSRVRTADGEIIARLVESVEPDSAPVAAALAAERLYRGALFKTDVESDQDLPLYKRWWFWTAVGTVVVASVVTGIVLSQSSTTYDLVPAQ